MILVQNFFNAFIAVFYQKDDYMSIFSFPTTEIIFGELEKSAVNWFVRHLDMTLAKTTSIF